jgi:cytochrome c peroxidase
LNFKEALNIALLGLVVLLWSCDKEADQISAASKIDNIPVGFPEVVYPAGNEYNPERWALGKKLFYDKALSINNTVSCATCHKAELAFSDDVPFSAGDNNLLGTSNAPTLANVAYHPYYTRTGGVPTLEMQVLVPIQEHNEFNFNIVEIVDRLKSDSDYAEAAWQCYNRELDPFVITRALANFERTLISGNSPYDQYQQGRQNALNASEKRGMQLFFSDKVNCSSCHNNFDFSNYAFENNGLYEEYVDLGRMRLTGLESDKALFKVPTLRNIAVTAPYMHDGSFHTLEEVVDHYNTGGQNHPNKSAFMHPLNLNTSQRNDLVAFLKSLTDYEFVTNQNFKP